MSLRWEQVVVDSRDPLALATWWSEALNWPITYQSEPGDADEPGGDVEIEIEIAPDAATHPSLLFIAVPEQKSVKNRLHLDFIPDDQAAEVERLLAMGASRADVGQGDDVTWVVLTDPEGNEFCVLRAR
ncbi:VOC family protein [Herbiconiux daphne]|uniref:VOC family protein n=1 Tax=Herbiconiux daphne TaxID=2970914 RepID=A0ABT2H2W5_9MICO|nr:VOC family protein [Herbiconiux daphne]MCS5734294.1 VOC family protein [Herbiconiux daphne]